MAKKSSKRAKKAPFFLSLSRHDAHNIELKSGFALREDVSSGSIDLYLFCPNNIPLGRWQKEEIKHDFFSRLRLASPRKVNLDTQRIQTEVLNELAEYEKTKSLQSLGGMLSEYLRREARFQESYLRSLFETETETFDSKEFRLLLQRLFDRFHSTEETVEQVRKSLPEKSSESSKEQRLFARYLHHCHLNLLARTLDELTRIQHESNLNKKLNQLFQDQISIVQKYIRQEHEFKVRFFSPTIDSDLSDPSKSAEALLALSQLKKYFQANMYVDISRKQVVKRFTEPLAALAAASAGAIAVLVQQFSMKPMLVSVGSTGIAVAGCGVALYVLRDRLKDKGKTVLKNKVSKFLPDEEQELVANERQIGRIREWFSTTQKSKVPSKIRSLRHKSTISKAEKHLHEEVVQLRRTIALNHKKQSESAPSNLDLQEVLRINFSRYLPYMDDAEKYVPVLDADGNLNKVAVRKEYHFHVCLEAKFFDRGQRKGRFRGLYRIVVDKAGIKDVVRIRG